MSPQLQSMLQQAMQAFQSGNFDGAELILKRVLQVDSKNLSALHILGLIKASQSRYKEAADYLVKAAKIDPNDATLQYNLAKALSDSGNNKEALSHHKKAVGLAPNNPEAWLNYGKTASDLRRYDEAIAHYDQALTLKPDYAEAWFNKGVALNELKRFDEAIAHYDQALGLKPDLAEAWSSKGVTLNGLQRYDEAIAHYDQALGLKPDLAEAWSNKGMALHALQRYDEAFAHYDQALTSKPDYAEAWSNKGATLHEIQRYDEAITHYDQALTLKPDLAVAWFNKGVTLYELKRYDEAITHYDQALTSKPDFAEAWSNKGVTLNGLQRYDEAIAHYDQALTLKPDYAEAWSNKGATLHTLHRYDEAITHYDQALGLKPDIDWVFGHLLHTKMKICSWISLAESLEIISKKVMANEKVITPFPMLALNDDPLLHQQCAKIYAQDRFPLNLALGPFIKRPASQKIRIGYFSADFKNHPVSFLTAELFELHDKNKFEIIGFSFGVDDQGTMRSRLSQAFNQFFDVYEKSDKEIAQLARELEIDIAVDLGGHTQDGRTGIFSHRAAPIQVNYLGYPGTMGTEYMDYIVADKTLIPKTYREFYSEQVIYMPDTYMVDDSKRMASSRVCTRNEFGLPENIFVFSCFNNGYKINPQVLDSWSRILLAAKDSILWLSENNEYFKSNIKNEFEKRRVDSSRIIFAQRVDLMADHLARYALADIFLDTLPFNAHTTAVDSLKSGIPVLTLIGKSFASRVAASLLNAIGLPELITNTQEEYEALAIELATNPQKLVEIKLKLANNRLTTPLFDTPLFTKNLEAAYLKMHERYLAGLPPECIYV